MNFAKHCFLLMMIFSMHTLQAYSRIGVFCGTDDALPSAYKEQAFELGKQLAQKHYSTRCASFPNGKPHMKYLKK